MKKINIVKKELNRKMELDGKICHDMLVAKMKPTLSFSENLGYGGW